MSKKKRQNTLSLKSKYWRPELKNLKLKFSSLKISWIMGETTLTNSLESMKSWKFTIKMSVKSYNKLNKKPKKMQKRQRDKLKI